MVNLNHRQRQFALEYCVDGNATQAAIRAGYAKRSAASQGERLLRKDEIQALIAKERRRLEYRTGITAERVRLEFARVALSDMREFAKWGIDEEGESVFGVRWTHSGNLTDDAAACIQEITETVRELEDGGTSSTKKFKLYDKLSALKELAKIMGLYPKDGPGDVNVTVNVEDVRRREEERKQRYDRLHEQLNAYRVGYDDANKGSVRAVSLDSGSTNDSSTALP